MEPFLLALFFLIICLPIAYLSLKLRHVRTDRYRGIWFERGKKVSPIWATCAYILSVFTVIVSGVELLFPGTAANAPIIGTLLTATGSVVIGLAIAQVVIWTFILLDRFLL